MKAETGKFSIQEGSNACSTVSTSSHWQNFSISRLQALQYGRQDVTIKRVVTHFNVCACISIQEGSYACSTVSTSSHGQNFSMSRLQALQYGRQDMTIEGVVTPSKKGNNCPWL